MRKNLATLHMLHKIGSLKMMSDDDNDGDKNATL
jgi:hypothetical protein